MSCEPSLHGAWTWWPPKKKGHRALVGRKMRLHRLSKTLFNTACTFKARLLCGAGESFPQFVREPKFCSRTKLFSSPNFCSKTELFELRNVRKPRFDCNAHYISWANSIMEEQFPQSEKKIVSNSGVYFLQILR